jgi:uracil-DNA glycosylase family 4
MQLRTREPTWFNAPVPSFGPQDAGLLVVGLAPGLQGANRTGRPFTGDFAGTLLYGALKEHGFARGCYQRRLDDSLELINCRITNAVRCVPPENKPTGAEIAACRMFLTNTIATMPRLRVVLALGRIAHDSVVTSLGLRPSAAPFAHGRLHAIGGLSLHDSYHCSRQNTNTGRLTAEMFGAVLARIRAELGR